LREIAGTGWAERNLDDVDLVDLHGHRNSEQGGAGARPGGSVSELQLGVSPHFLVPGRDGLDFRESIEPRDDLFVFDAVFKAAVDLVADVVGRAGGWTAATGTGMGSRPG
jgi:hypothetical protein